MKTRVFVVVTMLLLLLSLSIFLHPSVAHASPNTELGTQLEVYVGSSYQSIAVYGLDENGTYVSFCFQEQNYDTVIYTYDWYWQGSVYVYAYTNRYCSGTASRYTAACVPYYRESGYYWIDIWNSPSPC